MPQTVDPARTPRDPHHEESLGERIMDAAIAAELATGVREETLEAARRGALRRMGRMVAGGLLVLLGLALWVLPGPGTVVVIAGLVLLSRDFPWAARMVDRLRARLPQDEAGRTHPAVIVGSSMLAVGSVAFSIWFMFW